MFTDIPLIFSVLHVSFVISEGYNSTDKDESLMLWIVLLMVIHFISVHTVF